MRLAPGGGGGNAPESPADAQKRAAEQAKRDRAFAGKVEPAKDKEKAKADEAAPAAEGTPKEEVKGKRWVTLTGVVDNAQMNKNWLQALKNPAVAFPIYKRVDVERQQRQSDGSWTDWAMIDRNKSYDVLENLPEKDEEFVPEAKRPPSLVDELPFLRAGYWTGVHVARLVPAEIRNAPAPGSAKGGGSMNMGGDMMGGPGSSAAGAMRGVGGPGGGGGGSRSMGAGMRSDEGGSMSMGGMGDAGGTAEDPVVPNNEAAVMIRSLDFTVEPDTTYRFRARIVVKNPNYQRTDVNPGVEVDAEELIGPWSAETDAVTVPADVVAYAQAPEPNVRRKDLVSFQVIKWDPVTGQTVVKNGRREGRVKSSANTAPCRCPPRRGTSSSPAQCGLQ